MRVRSMSPSGDMTFGLGSGDFLVDSAAAVAQLIDTRLRLWTNEWFLDTSEGTPYASKILGPHTMTLYDSVIQARILGTPGVIGLVSYQSELDRTARRLTVHATVNTQFSLNQGVTASATVPVA